MNHDIETNDTLFESLAVVLLDFRRTRVWHDYEGDTPTFPKKVYVFYYLQEVNIAISYSTPW